MVLCLCWVTQVLPQDEREMVTCADILAQLVSEATLTEVFKVFKYNLSLSTAITALLSKGKWNQQWEHSASQFSGGPFCDRLMGAEGLSMSADPNPFIKCHKI